MYFDSVLQIFFVPAAAERVSFEHFAGKKQVKSLGNAACEACVRAARVVLLFEASPPAYLFLYYGHTGRPPEAAAQNQNRRSDFAPRKRAHTRLLIHRGEPANRKNQSCLDALRIRQAAFSEAFRLHKYGNTTICVANPQQSSYLTFLPTAALAIFQHPASPTAASMKNVGMAG